MVNQSNKNTYKTQMRNNNKCNDEYDGFFILEYGNHASGGQGHGQIDVCFKYTDTARTIIEKAINNFPDRFRHFEYYGFRISGANYNYDINDDLYDSTIEQLIDEGLIIPGGKHSLYRFDGPPQEGVPPEPGEGGGNKKEYIKLQSGGKRLVRYGKRGGRYYMKGGKKHYIK